MDSIVFSFLITVKIHFWCELAFRGWVKNLSIVWFCDNISIPIVKFFMELMKESRHAFVAFVSC